MTRQRGVLLHHKVFASASVITGEVDLSTKKYYLPSFMVLQVIFSTLPIINVNVEFYHCHCFPFICIRSHHRSTGDNNTPVFKEVMKE